MKWTIARLAKIIDIDRRQSWSRVTRDHAPRQVVGLLTPEPERRGTAEQALTHEWLTSEQSAWPARPVAVSAALARYAVGCGCASLWASLMRGAGSRSRPRHQVPALPAPGAARGGPLRRGGRPVPHAAACGGGAAGGAQASIKPKPLLHPARARLHVDVHVRNAPLSLFIRIFELGPC